jgi:hypothetical protein
MVVGALSGKYVPPNMDCLIAEFDWMSILYCFAYVAHVETQFILRSTILDRVRGARKC